jgi:hypothetical protein
MIPSLLQIPSAVSDSKLHSVLPNNGKGDFTFDRSTGATRINRDGLIEEVGYFSSELVQNGNFSELGSEIIVNGDFATDSNWNLGTGWTINNGKLRGDNVSAVNVFQAKVYASGKTYKITYTISDYVKGTVIFQIGGGGSAVDGQTRTANGTYTEFLTATSNHTSARFRGLSASGGFTGSIDNVSVKQVDPNDRWTLGTGWSLGTDKVVFNGGSDAAVQQSNVVQPSTLYRVLFTVTDITTGSLQLRLGNTGVVDVSVNSNSNFSFDLTTDSSGTAVYFRAIGGFDGAISNISVKEVQGDRPRLSYDITNGVVEDKPHLLLEPSATNLVTFSEDLTQWSNLLYTIVTANSTTSPDGSVNADKLVAGTTNGLQLRVAPLSLTSGNTYTFSTFVKNYGGNYVILYMNDSTSQGIKVDLINETFTVMGASTNHFIKKFSNGWYQIGFTRTIDTNVSGLNAVPSLDGNNVSFLGDGVNGVYIWGTQAEQQSYATSHIPTAGTTITRAAETCNNSKPSVNSTEGVLYAEIQALASDSTDKVITMSDGSTSNRVQVYFNSSNQIVGGLISGGSGQAAITYSTDIKLVSKIAFKYKQNDFALWVNGSEVGTDVVGNPATGLNVIDFDNGAGGANFYGKLKGLAVYNEALSKSQLMQLTGVTASSIYNNFVTRTASFTVEALNEVKKVIDNL